MLHWSSVKTGDHWNTLFGAREKWAFEILGTKAVAAHQSGLEFAFLDSPFLAGKEGEVRWGPLPEPEAFAWPEPARHPVRSLIHALETGGEPIASGRDGAWAIEMVAAVYESERLRARVEFPLTERGNPLLRF
jgi:predicted dehydrogenase